MGTLYVVGTPIGNLQDMTPRARETLAAVDLIAAEGTRHSARLLRHFGITTPMVSYHQHNLRAREAQILESLSAGDVALVSDAGTPAIADPGQELVAAAASAGYRVVPIPGPSSLVAAISASGLVSGPFVFLGFVQRHGDTRRVELGKAAHTGFPIVLFESPNRLVSTLRELANQFPARVGVVARELTKLHEDIRRGFFSELEGHFEHAPPRGECVIVIGPELERTREAVNDDTAATLLRQLLDDGLKPSRAVRAAAEITGRPGAELYAIVRQMREADTAV